METSQAARSIILGILVTVSVAFTALSLGLKPYQGYKAHQYFNTAEQSLKNENYKEAKQNFEDGLRILPDEVQALFGLADAYKKLGEFEAAVCTYREILYLKPGNYEAQYQLAMTYSKIGRYSEAKALLENYLVQNPDDTNFKELSKEVKLLDKLAKKRQVRVHTKQYADDIYFAYFPLSMMPLKVYISDGSNIKNYKTEYKQCIPDACAQWTKASNGLITFKIVDDKKQADIVFNWLVDLEKNRKEEKLSDTLGETQKKYSKGDFIKSATIDIDLITEDLNVDTMMKICIHELGHALGIETHSNNYDDIMYFAIDKSTKARVSPRDAQTIKRIYATQYIDNGNKEFSSKNYMAAIKEFQKAFDYDPTYAEALIDIADAYKKLKDFKKAQYYYEKAIEVSPNYGVAYASLGDFLIQQSQRSKGMALINKGVEVDPKSYWAYALQGDNLRDTMEIDLAIKAHSKAHDLRPNYAFGYLNLAVTYLCANQPDKAIKLMDQAKTKFKWNNKWSTYFPITLYCAYMQNNQPGKAKAVVKEDLVKANKKEWPYAVLQYLSGTISKEQLMRLAVDQDKKTEAHAYAGYFEYYSGHKDKAKLHWQWVIKDGSPTYIEVPLSKYMLKSLDKP